VDGQSLVGISLAISDASDGSFRSSMGGPCSLSLGRGRALQDDQERADEESAVLFHNEVASRPSVAPNATEPEPRGASPGRRRRRHTATRQCSIARSTTTTPHNNEAMQHRQVDGDEAVQLAASC
jgi:hypothetical protein